VSLWVDPTCVWDEGRHVGGMRRVATDMAPRVSRKTAVGGSTRVSADPSHLFLWAPVGDEHRDITRWFDHSCYRSFPPAHGSRWLQQHG
jgi:hypothetical protein